MIISASRRTDIPAWYTEWFLRRVREGYVCVRNPMRLTQVSRVILTPKDCIVFWTKNPLPILPRLEELGGIPFYFQFTLTAYGKDLEPCLPDRERLLKAFRQLARKIGPERTLWRYDPVLLTDCYTLDWHLERFEAIARILAGYTRVCTVSFLDLYAKIRGAVRECGMVRPSDETAMCLLERFAELGVRNGMELRLCAESLDASRLGIVPARCIDGELVERLTGSRPPRDRNQRPYCGCAASVDIGVYDTCPSGCRYCYAVRGPAWVRRMRAEHDLDSPLLVGNLVPQDIVRDREDDRHGRLEHCSLFVQKGKNGA